MEIYCIIYKKVLKLLCDVNLIMKFNCSKYTSVGVYSFVFIYKSLSDFIMLASRQSERCIFTSVVCFASDTFYFARKDKIYVQKVNYDFYHDIHRTHDVIFYRGV